MHLTAHIHGAALDEGRADARAGFGVVLESPCGAYVNAQQHLCGCCGQAQSGERAELAALVFVLRFAHELVRAEAPGEGDAVDASDCRVVDAVGVQVVVRTDSEHVAGGFDRRSDAQPHRDLWDGVFDAEQCVRHAGMLLRVDHVRGHAGDRGGEEADALAREAAAGSSHDSDYISCCGRPCTVDGAHPRLPPARAHAPAPHAL